VGSYQRDALQNIVGAFQYIDNMTGPAQGTGAFRATQDGGTVTYGGASFGINSFRVDFDASRVARISPETRSAAARVAPVINI
jgi:hypothetical protein